jgi:hypothetical protein
MRITTPEGRSWRSRTSATLTVPTCSVPRDLRQQELVPEAFLSENTRVFRRHIICSCHSMAARHRASFLAVTVAVALLAACGTSTGDGEHGGDGGGASGASAGAGKGGGSAAGTAGSGGTSAGAGGSATGGASGAGTGGSSTGGDAGGALPCGATSCGPAQYCVFPCCGGAPPACFQLPDGSTCPAGSHSGCFFGTQCTNPATCCQPDPCTPPPPYCSDTLPIGCLLEGRSCRLACA